MSLPYALMPVCRQQFLDGNGEPYAGGTLYFYVAGTSTPKEVYATADGATSLGTSLVLDADGYAEAIYLAPGGYKVALYDADAAQVWEQDGVEDIGLTFLESLGEELATGTADVSSGYEILETDWFVTVASTGGANPCVIYLPFANAHPGPLTIKNVGTVPLAVTLRVGDTIDTLDEVFTVPAATAVLFPSVSLIADGTSAWWVTGSHGVV